MHQLPKSCRAVLTGLATAGIAAALVIGQATSTTALLQLSNAVIAIGGQGNPTSSRVRDKLDGTVVPGGYDVYAVPYPATIELTKSRNVAVPLVDDYITDHPDKEPLIVAGYSLGTMAAEQEKRNLQKRSDAPLPGDLSFVMIASPFAANGGIFGRFPGISVPLIANNMGPAQPSRYSTTYSALEYDPYADFPAYFNPLAMLNSALSIRYGHPDAFYDQLDPTKSPRYVTTAGADTYVLYYNPHLPLFGPLRELASRTGTSAFIEPLISAIEPLARVLVDMSYTDRVNANPAASVHFSLVTPPKNVVKALKAIPGAIVQGIKNLTSGGHTTAAPPNPIGNLQEGPAAPSETTKVESSTARVAAAPAPAVERPRKKLREKPIAPTKVVSPAADDPIGPTVTSKGNKVASGKAHKTRTKPTGTSAAESPTTAPADSSPAPASAA